MESMECEDFDLCLPARTEYEDFDVCLPAIWLVFGGSYLNHSNAPNITPTPEAHDDCENPADHKKPPDHREQILVNLLSAYLENEFVSSSQSFNPAFITQLQFVVKLLKLWSEDLTLIYEIREQSITNTNEYDLKVEVLAQRILTRIQNFNVCTIIPNGLSQAEHTDGNENVCLAILTKDGLGIDWTQVNPGSDYHQSCPDLINVRCNAFMKISDIDCNNITKEWVHLLLTLKSIIPKQKYKELMLYEWLLSHLNGKVVFQSEPDEGFVTYSHSSPVHTWQVVDQSFRYLLRYFIGDTYLTVYHETMTSFKIFLMEKTLAAYQKGASKETEQCHFLLQEIVRDVSQLALDHGNENQKKYAFELIEGVKAAIDHSCGQKQEKLKHESKIDDLSVSSFGFPPLRLLKPSSSSHSSPLLANLEVRPKFVKPRMQDNIIDYLIKFNRDFVDELSSAEDFDSTALLCSGIEVFFIDYLSKTKILDVSWTCSDVTEQTWEVSAVSPFSRDDVYLAECLKSLAERYFLCQGRLMKHFLSDLTYEPHQYAKNVIIQFFAYAAVAALNYRDAGIGPLIANYQLSTDCSKSLTLSKIIPYLVIEDTRWLNVLFTVEHFFKHMKGQYILFSSQKFLKRKPFYMHFSIESDLNDIDLRLAFDLLKSTNAIAFDSFVDDKNELEATLLHKKWTELAYTQSEEYLPKIYTNLSLIAYSAKLALTGFNFFEKSGTKNFSPDWLCTKKHGDNSIVHFSVNKKSVSTKAEISQISSYRLKTSERFLEEPYQCFISNDRKTEEENAEVISLHLGENDFIANLSIKPDTMDCNRYLQLGFLQSAPHLKIERLYIALKDQQLNFSSEQEGTLIRQTLFEISILKEIDQERYTLLQWTAFHKPELIHALGVLLIQKARTVQYRLTQHHAMGDILLVALGLLTYYPSAHKETFTKGIEGLYYLLKGILMNPPAHLSDQTLLHLNAYLIISIQANPQLLETQILTILKAFLAIQKFKVKGTHLDNYWILRICAASVNWCSQVENLLQEDPDILNSLMSSAQPQWNQESRWVKSKAGLLFKCDDHAIKPLQGCIYFQNQPIMGLPSGITEHKVFRKYFGEVTFTVVPSEREINSQMVPCYLSVDHKPDVRLTLIKEKLLLEELIDDSYQRYVPAYEISCQNKYPEYLYELPNGAGKLQHWLKGDKFILIKDQYRQIVYEWNLKSNTLLSMRHGGFVVPWIRLQTCSFKTWLQQVESPNWVELIAQPASDNSNVHIIESLNLLRFGLHFDFKSDEFLCKEIHGYTIAKIQHLNTLHGFSNYMVLERKERSSACVSVKIIIPHREIDPQGAFYDKIMKTSRNKLRSPAYFIYDYDSKLCMLKGHSTCARLYLALLFYSSASLDNHDVSGCNAYHLARENLELCWKDQPYDEIELSIIKQFFKNDDMRGFHSHSLALCLKVVSLLICSLRLDFLYTDDSAKQSKEESDKILANISKQLPRLLLTYLRNKSTIFVRIQLSSDEEEEIIKHCLRQTSISINSGDDTNEVLSFIKVYHQINFQRQSKNLPPSYERKPFNSFYSQFFSMDALHKTNFEDTFQKNTNVFKFSHNIEEFWWTSNLSSGIESILRGRFHVKNFIFLYNLAKNSCISLSRYCYLLHYVVLMTNSAEFPSDVRIMLARALLLVAENPAKFPESPRWFNDGALSVNLTQLEVTKADVMGSFPMYHWKRPRDSYDEVNEEEKKKEEQKYNAENERIWRFFRRYDLDDDGIPHRLPENVDYFELEYESQMTFHNPSKKEVVRKIYLQAAYNNSMSNFFYHVLNICDTIKGLSCMGRQVAPFIKKIIKVHFEAKKKNALTPIAEGVSLERWALPQQPIIDFDQFFAISLSQAEPSPFLFEAQLSEPKNGYQLKFYSELKDSWLAYQEEKKYTYSWLSPQSLSELELVLQTRYKAIHEQAEQLWDHIAVQFEQKSNRVSNDYFALRWHSGKVRYYNKRDLLTLLIEPHKLEWYNPDRLTNKDHVIQEILDYLIYEINAAKLIRVLNFVEQYKEADNDAEEFSVMQSLVRSLQENIDPESFKYPNWLLFQFENGIIIRNNQKDLISLMLQEEGKAMYQLNMGEGKTSVILPLLSCNLADGDQLLRINVLPALHITMKEFLRQCFSGLIRKRVYTLPFNRDTDISTRHIALISEMLQTCQKNRHILLVTPEYRLCLQLKIRELLLENQKQMEATNKFNWRTYRQRAEFKNDVYKDLTESEIEEILLKQDQCLKRCLQNDGYIDTKDTHTNKILKAPPKGQNQAEFGYYKKVINDSSFREWSCLRAAYRELSYNSALARADTREKLTLLIDMNALAAIDLIDESDEILKHGTELNYTVGDRCAFAGGEFRWEIPQFFIKAIFCDVEIREAILAGKVQGFTAINENYSEGGGVPFIQLLSESYFDSHIKPILIKRFFSENLPSLRKLQTSADSQLAQDGAVSLRQYVAGQLQLNAENKVLAFLADKGPLKDKLLIAKGWLSHGILFHVLNSKYRVQFGLNLNSEGGTTKRIAIPFLGKDTPSPRSEFSHPDVMLGFTIICYLYKGLSKKELKETLLNLKGNFSAAVGDMRLNKWTRAGETWIKTQTGEFPPLPLTSLQQLDLADELCLAQAHQFLSGNYLTIFFYLNQFVLLEEATQYRYKISANAHSLVGYNAALGFSGTDDRKITMPFQVQSICSKSERGTNGKLLSVLTQDRNSSYHSLETNDSKALLKELCDFVAENQNCHALIDAGALVTGLSNSDVAKFLLSHLPNTFVGIVYFSDEDNNLIVQTKDGKITALQDCYLDKRFLFHYLDDIHTRGTDLKLPLNCRAVLTIGLSMLKDKLMQAAMRLRQLAQKQSVSLWGTQTVTLAIARENNTDPKNINSLEVIKWVTRNTINHINGDLFPVAVRKINFEFLRKAEEWLQKAPVCLNTLVQCCQDKEMFKLEDFYSLSPQCEDLAVRLDWLVAERLQTFWLELESEFQNKNLSEEPFYETVFNGSIKNQLKKQLSHICEEVRPYLQRGFIHHFALDDDEEKEIMMEVEIVQERRVSVKIDFRKALKEQPWDVHLIRKNDFINKAIKRGIVMPLKAIKRYVQFPANIKEITWHKDVYMTANYIESVKCEQKDHYLRPVDVVFIHRSSEKSEILVLSGQEASSIKSKFYQNLGNNLLVHINDVDGHTQLPNNSVVTKQEQKLLTIVKLFSGECHYNSLKEVQRIAKRVGRVYPQFFCSLNMDSTQSEKLYEILIQEGYLDFAGVMTGKLLKILRSVKAGDPIFEMPEDHHLNEKFSGKVHRIFQQLIIRSSNSLQNGHTVLWEWLGARNRLREYPGSALESIINPENQIKSTQ